MKQDDIRVQRFFIRARISDREAQIRRLEIKLTKLQNRCKHPHTNTGVDVLGDGYRVCTDCGKEF